MVVEKTKIEGCYVITPSVYGDDRGYFMESFNLKEFEEKTNQKINFVQDNESASVYGVLRGMHFQKGEHAQAKLVRVVFGSVYDVAVDLRKDSPTFGNFVGVELTEDNKKQLFIPRGCAHGFYVFSEKGAIFQYKCDNYYHKESDGGIPWDDKNIDINWEDYIHGTPILSEKDKIYEQIDSWKFQLIKEKNEAFDKLKKLERFISSDTFNIISSNDDKKLIFEQERRLTQYLDILIERIKNTDFQWD